MWPINNLDLIFVGIDQWLPIAVGLVLWIGLAGIGLLVAGRHTTTEANVIFGWATISTVFTLVGVVQRAPFLILTILAAGAAVAGIILAVRRRQSLFVPGMWRILVLALPMFLIAGAMDPSQWDEFSHWLPAPEYLLEVNGFPNAEKPNNGTTMLSAYPYGWPMLSYLAGRVAGNQLFNIGGVLNLLLLLTFTPFALRTVMEIVGRPMVQPIGWGIASICALSAAILNPSFVQKIVLTAYSGVSTSVVTGFCAILTIQFLNALGGNSRRSPWSAAWQLSLALMLLINLRQTNLVVFLIFILAILLLVARARELTMARLAAFLPLIAIPALIVYGAWRVYVGAELSAYSGSEATFKAFADWNIQEIPMILLQMLFVAGKKIGFFGVLFIASLFAIAGLIRDRGRFDRLLIVCAAVFAGYNVFLLFTYVAHFGAQNALSVVSFWRYNTQIGGVAIVCVLVGGIFIWNRYLGFERNFIWPARLALILAVGLPFVFAPKLRFDLEPPKPHYTAVAKDIEADGGLIGDLYVMDPKGSGESAVMSRFYLNKIGKPWMSAFHQPTPEKIRRYVGGLKENDYLLVHSISEGLSDVLDHSLDARRSYMLQKTGNTWTLVKEWKKPSNHPY
jgi:hypothetical protein